MSVTVTKLKGDDIPEHLRHPNIAMVYRVTDANGNSRYLTDDVEAAPLAVNISDRQQLARLTPGLGPQPASTESTSALASAWMRARCASPSKLSA